jgi:hypothetical protein
MGDFLEFFIWTIPKTKTISEITVSFSSLTISKKIS